MVSQYGLALPALKRLQIFPIFLLKSTGSDTAAAACTVDMGEVSLRVLYLRVSVTMCCCCFLFFHILPGIHTLHLIC